MKLAQKASGLMVLGTTDYKHFLQTRSESVFGKT